MPSPPSRITTWHAGHPHVGMSPENGNSVQGMGSAFNSSVTRQVNLSSANLGPGDAFAYYSAVLDRTPSQSESINFYYGNLVVSPTFCFSTTSANAGNRDGDFTPDDQGDLTRVFIPGGTIFSTDFYLQSSIVSGTTLDPPRATVFAILYAVSLTGPYSWRQVALSASIPHDFQVGGGSTRVTTSFNVTNDIVIERNEALVLSMGVSGRVCQPAVSGTVVTRYNLLWGQQQPGVGGSTVVRGTCGLTLRTKTKEAASGLSNSAGDVKKLVYKTYGSDSEGTGGYDRYVEFHRSGVSVSSALGEEVKTIIKKRFGIDSDSVGAEMTKTVKKPFPAVSVSESELLKKIGVVSTASSESMSEASRIAEFFRNAGSVGVADSDGRRIVTYSRSAIAVSNGDIDPRDVKICIPITSLSNEGGGGGTVVNVRPVYVFDG